VTVKVENNAGVKDASLFIAAILGESLLRPCYRTHCSRGVPQQKNGATAPVVCASRAQQQAKISESGVLKAVCSNAAAAAAAVAITAAVTAHGVGATHAIAMTHCADGQQLFSLV
jgi:hypothetical protein